MPPSRTITIEITHARTGRSMKKRASIGWVLQAGFGEALDARARAMNNKR